MGLYLASLYSYVLFHVIAESFSIIIAVFLFLIVWNPRHLSTHNYVLFLSIVFLFAALIDFVYTLACKDYCFMIATYSGQKYGESGYP